MAQLNLTEDDIQFFESWYTPKDFSECMFHDWDNFSIYKKGKFGNLRLYQQTMISDEPLIDFEMTAEYHGMDKKQEFQMKKMVGDIYCFGARRFGKTLVIQMLELLHHMITSDEGNKIAFSSVDQIHLDKVLNPIKIALSNHKIMRKFVRSAKGTTTYNFDLKNGVNLLSINFTLNSNPGEQWLGTHAFRVYVEEACFSGRTRIACIDSEGNRETIRLSDLVNDDKWKHLKILSYNFDTEKIEVKKILRPFKKKVYDYTHYQLEILSHDKNTKRVLEPSQKQKFWTSEGYKNVTELKASDTIYSLDYQMLSRIQKEIVVGTLLGDACLNKRDVSSTLSFCHGKSQAEYLKYKQEVFANIFRCNYRRKNEVAYDFKDTSFGGSVARITTNACIDLNEFKTFKQGDKINFDILDKYFSPISFAFWIMDDGSLSLAKGKTFFGKKYLCLHTQGFSFECCEELCRFLNKRYGIVGKVLTAKNKRVHREYPYLFFDNESTKKITNMVKEYVHPLFYYKLFHRTELCDFIYRGGAPKFNNLGLDVKDLLMPSKIMSISTVPKKSWTMYDVEVEGNNNFFANGILVHNSLETEEVYDKRKCALAEVGAVFRVAGMTDFTPYSPPGKAFYKLENQKHVLNYPQFVNSFFDEQEHTERIEEYGGISTSSYKVYVKGEVVEDGVTALDMKRIRDNCYMLNKQGKFTKKITSFEITKENFKFWKNLIVVRRPENTERIWISLDVGKKVTEIVIHSEVNKNYGYIYNIMLLNLTQQEIEIILNSIIQTLNANYIAIDCGDGEGRGIYSGLEKTLTKAQMRLVYYDGSMKLKVGYEYIEKEIDGQIVKEIKLDKDGKPVYRYELMADWSVKRLKDLLYDGRSRIPEDLKFDRQFSAVIETVMNGKTKYKCISTQGDHLFDAWKVFAIAEFIKAEFNDELIEDGFSEEWGSGVCN